MNPNPIPDGTERERSINKLSKAAESEHRMSCQKTKFAEKGRRLIQFRYVDLQTTVAAEEESPEVRLKKREERTEETGRNRPLSLSLSLRVSGCCISLGIYPSLRFFLFFFPFLTYIINDIYHLFIFHCN